MRKLVFYFNWLDSWYCYLRLNEIFRILAESIKQRCQYCIFRVELNNFRKDIFYWNKLSISIYFRILRKKLLGNRRKKIKTFRTAFNLSAGQIVWKNVFFWFVTILHICSDCDGNTFEIRLKNLFRVLQTACTCPNERFERNDFLSSVSNSKFFQTLSRKNPAVLWKTNFTRPDEPMKNEVLIRSSLVTKKVFGIWRRYFGFRLKHLSMTVDTAFYAFQEKIQQHFFFETFFVS